MARTERKREKVSERERQCEREREGRRVRDGETHGKIEKWKNRCYQREI